jgi:membrane protease YdiL (CAAX protease family)
VLPEQEQYPQPQEVSEQSAVVWLTTSVAFYGAMFAGSIFLGKKYGLVDQFLNSPLNLKSSLPYMGVMVGLFLVSTLLAEVLPSFKELKLFYQKTLIPQLKRIPLFGLAMMAAGAGIGEEALFRGVLQNWVIEQVANTGLAEFSVVLGVFVSSIAFGLAHAITASYFIFALAAGVVFGFQYLNCGLPAAAFTHALYDFIAFIVVIQYWGSKNIDRNVENEMKN